MIRLRYTSYSFSEPKGPISRDQFIELKRMNSNQFKGYLSTMRADVRRAHRPHHEFERNLLFVSTPIAVIAFFIPFGILLTLLYILLAPMLASTLFLSHMSHATYVRKKASWLRGLRKCIVETPTYEDYLSRLSQS